MTDPSAPSRPVFILNRRWVRFSVRGLLAITFLVSLPLAWLGNDLAGQRTEQKLVAAIESTGGKVVYARDAPGPDRRWRHAAKWVAQRFGQRYRLDHVEHIYWQPNSRTASAATVLSRLIRRSPQLKTVAVSGIALADEDMVDFGRLKNLRRLELSGAPVTDKGIAYVTDLSNLEVLVLDLTELSDDLLADLAGLPHLQELRIKGTRVTPEGLARFSQLRDDVNVDWLPALDERSKIAARELNRRTWQIVIGVGGTAFVVPPDPSALTSEEREWLKRLRNLEARVYLNDPDGRTALAFFARLKNLSGLSVTRLDDEALRELLVPPELRSLKLWAHKLSGEGFAQLADLPSLEELLLEPAPDAAAVEQLSRAGKLRRLRLWRGTVEDDDLSPLAKLDCLDELEFNQIHFSERGTDPLGSLPRLKKLRFDTCELDDDDLGPLLKLTTLESLAFASPKITDAGLLRLAELKSLKELQCLYAGGVSPEAKARFRQLRPDVKFSDS